MSESLRKITRREFLKAAGIGLAASSVAGILQACGAAPTDMPATKPPPLVPTVASTAVPPTSAPQSAKSLRWDWWGEQEAPGLETWVKKTLDLYKQKSGVDIQTTLVDSSVVVTDIQTTSASGNPPDLMYFWNGIYHMESVWMGYVEPLNGLLPDDMLKASGATVLSIFQGKQYRVGWYACSPIILYNKDMFDKAGLNADQPPKTWEEFMAACDKLKSKGFTPIIGGLKDGPWGEWYLGHSLAQNLDTPGEVLSLFNGVLDWREPKYWEQWQRLGDLWKAGFINNDFLSIDLYPGIDNFGTGKGAITEAVVSHAPKMQSMLGAEKVGAMVFPYGGKGKMAGKPMVDTQGIGIASGSKSKEAAAELLKFMGTSEVMTSLFNEVKVFPTYTTWDGDKEIQDPTLKFIWQNWVKNPAGIPYISNLMPTLFWTDAMFVNSQNIISGKFTGEQAGQNAYDVTQKWVQQNPDLAEKYKAWTKEMNV